METDSATMAAHYRLPFFLRLSAKGAQHRVQIAYYEIPLEYLFWTNKIQTSC